MLTIDNSGGGLKLQDDGTYVQSHDQKSDSRTVFDFKLNMDKEIPVVVIVGEYLTWSPLCSNFVNSPSIREQESLLTSRNPTSVLYSGFLYANPRVVPKAERKIDVHVSL